MRTTLSDIQALLLKPERHEITILTANQRQARMLRSKLLSETDVIIELPEILTIENWVQTLWAEQQRYLNERCFRTLLNTPQALWAWKLAIEQINDIPPLIDASSLARQLKSTEDIHRLYQLRLDANLNQLTEETHFYLKVKSLKDKLVSDWGAIDVYDAITLLIELFNANQTRFGTTVYTFGFVEIPPIHESLIRSVTGTDLCTLVDDNRNISADYIALNTEKDELDYAASWAVNVLNDHPDASIAIVVPNLNSEYKTIQQALMRTLETENYIDAEPSTAKLFDISMSESLWNIKLIRDAVLLLKLFDKQIHRDNASSFIQSCYWSGLSTEQRAESMKRLSKLAELNLSSSAFLDILKPREEQEDVSTLYARFTKLKSQQPETKTPRTPSQWVAWFIDCLDTMGWPGEAPLNSMEFQYSNAFTNLLNTVSSFDALHKQPIAFVSFRSLLEDCCLQQVAHLELKRPKIRVMGLMEAAEQPFDHCLVIGMNEGIFPEAAKPNAFLPISLQKENATPRSSFEREHRYALKLLEGIKTCSRHITFTRYQQDDSGHTLASPILNELGVNDVTSMKSVSIESLGLNEHLQHAINFDGFASIPVGDAPPYPPNTLITGGAGHLNAYWNNPLFAYFQYGLGVNKPDDLHIGLSPSVRGNFYHHVLEKIYANYPSKNELSHFFESSTFVAELSEYANSIWRSLWAKTKQSAVTVEEYEKSRLIETVSNFIEMDISRSDDFHVLSLEEKIRIKLQERYLDVRIDRVDQISPNSVLVIDYKTGKNTLSGVSKKSTSDFQLPLYAIAKENSGVEGVSFALLNENPPCYLGLCSEKIQISGLHESTKISRSELPEGWQATLDHWRENACELIDALSKGEAPYLVRNKQNAVYSAHFEQAVRQEERELPYE